MGSNGSDGTIQTMWARDDADPLDENMLVMDCIHQMEAHDLLQIRLSPGVYGTSIRREDSEIPVSWRVFAQV